MSNLLLMKVDDLIDKAGGIGPLAERLTVDRATIYDWKRNGCIPPSRLFQVHDVLGIPMADLRVLTVKPQASAA